MAFNPTHPNVARRRAISRQAFAEVDALRKSRQHAAIVAQIAEAAQRARVSIPVQRTGEHDAAPARKGPARDARGRFVKAS